MKYIFITKYINSFAMNKYAKISRKQNLQLTICQNHNSKP